MDTAGENESWASMFGPIRPYSRGRDDDTVPLPALVPPPPKKTETPPRNNDGRIHCWWCQSRTRPAGGGQYDVCTNKECGR